MRKFLAVLVLAVMVAGPAAADRRGGVTDPANLDTHPGTYGLCNAYFRGEGGEHGNKNNAAPFAALAEAADDGDDKTSPAEDIAAFCAGREPSNGQAGGSGATADSQSSGKKQK
jgi:hypothetical protein